MKVKDVLVNQKKNFNILKQAYDNDRLSHAYLFYGEKGTGKKEMAYALACMLFRRFLSSADSNARIVLPSCRITNR